MIEQESEQSAGSNASGEPEVEAEETEKQAVFALRSLNTLDDDFITAELEKSASIHVHKHRMTQLWALSEESWRAFGWGYDEIERQGPEMQEKLRRSNVYLWKISDLVEQLKSLHFRASEELGESKVAILYADAVEVDSFFSQETVAAEDLRMPLESLVVVCPLDSAMQLEKQMIESDFLFQRKKAHVLEQDQLDTRFGAGAVMAFEVTRRNAKNHIRELIDNLCGAHFCESQSPEYKHYVAEYFGIDASRELQRVVVAVPSSTSKKKLELLRVQLEAGEGCFFVTEQSKTELTEEQVVELKADFLTAHLYYVEGRGAEALVRLRCDESDYLKISNNYSLFAGKNRTQYTYAMLKPDTMANGSVDAILDVIDQCGFSIVRRKVVQLTPDVAGEFYAEHKGKRFFGELLDFMCSKPILALVLKRDDAILAWRHYLGPTNTFTARKNAPMSIRGRFGTDATMNACHGADSEASALREIQFFFPCFARTVLGHNAALDASDFLRRDPETHAALKRCTEELLSKKPIDARKQFVDKLENLSDHWLRVQYC